MPQQDLAAEQSSAEHIVSRGVPKVRRRALPTPRGVVPSTSHLKYQAG